MAETRISEVTTEMLLDWYRRMVFVRRFEEQAERSFRRGKIGGYLHLYSGQEAVTDGVGAAEFLVEVKRLLENPVSLGLPGMMARAPAVSRMLRATYSHEVISAGFWPAAQTGGKHS